MANESWSMMHEGSSENSRLVELRDEQVERWQAGDRPSVERYQAENPDLEWSPEILLDFVFGEYQIRQHLGESPTREEYEARFPDLAPAFRYQIEVDVLFNSRIVQLEKASKPGGSPLPDLFQKERTIAGIIPPLTIRKPEIEGYEILGELGRGGMGVVYKARQHRPNRLVAVKMVLTGSHSSGELLARFSQESDAIARLQHPNIVQVLDVGESNGIPYLTLEWAEGGSLERRLDGTPRQVESSVLLVEKLARAAHHAHLRGIIHRDLKPANVLFTVDGVPKLTDFGLAKMLDSPLGQTMTGHMLGTPCYMAPEQAREGARDVGPAADVYSLGAMLYELVTGRPPFRASTPASTIQLALTHEPPSPSKMRPDLPRDVETIVLKCLQKDPGRRYLTADELADDILRFTRGEQIRAQPDSWSTLFVNWSTRHPIYAACAGLAALTNLILPVVLALLWLRTFTALIDSQGEVDKLEHRMSVVLLAQEAEVKGEKDRHDAFSASIRRLDENLLAGDDLLAQLEGERPSPSILATRNRALDQSARALREVLSRPVGRHDMGDEVTRKTLAQLLRRQASVCDMLGQPGAADDACREAIRLEQDLLDQSKDSLDEHFEMAQSWLSEGERQIAAHRGRRALDAYLHAAHAIDTIVSNGMVVDWIRRSNVSGFQLHLTGATATREASQIQDELNQVGEAIASQQRSVQSLRYAIDFTPEERADHTALAQGLVHLGELYARAGRASQASAADAEAVKFLRAMLLRDLALPPTIVGEDWLRFSRQGEIHEWLGEALSRLGEHSDAAAHLCRAIDIQQAILDRYSGPAPRAVLVRLRSHLGHWATFNLANHRLNDAMTAARRRAALAGGEPGETLQAARVLSMTLAQARETSRFEDEPLGDEAMTLLRASMAAGLAVGSPFTDPAFDAIRNRDDFRQLAAPPAPDQLPPTVNN
jgi:tetratricopeptide (TPR) repeat protein/tRNA A-37 threonylcarbamoyl transferase component Bud32